MMVALAAVPHVMVTHDPAQRGATRECGRQAGSNDRQGAEDAWLELMIDGMTFDLLGLAPDPGVAVPEIEHRFGCSGDIAAETVEAVGLMPGPHIAEGAHTLPVVRALIGLGAALAEEVAEVSALLWTPSRSAIARPFFVRAVSDWLVGGPFPTQGLVVFAAKSSGPLRSEGLTFFIGQELELPPALVAMRVAETRLEARLVHELVALGRLAHPLEIIAEDGTPLLLDPGGGGDTIEVRPM